MKNIVRFICLFAPFVALGSFHVREVQYTDDVRAGLPRIAGIPFISVCYLVWIAFPLVYSERFRSSLLSKYSWIGAATLAILALIGRLQGADPRGIQMDAQLWLGLWAGLGIGYLVIESRYAATMHIGLVAFMSAMMLWTLMILSRRGFIIGFDRIYDPIAFLYMDLGIPMAAATLYWRHRLGMMAYLFVGIAMGILLYASAVIVMARAHLIATIATCIVVWLLFLGDKSQRRRRHIAKWMNMGITVFLVFGLVLYLIKRSDEFGIVGRFREDTYRWDENGRAQEVVVAFYGTKPAELIFGKGLGYVIASDMGDGVGLHIGIATLAFKFGAVLTVFVVIPVLAITGWRLFTTFRKQMSGRAQFARAGLVPGAVAYCVQSCLSGGYKEIVVIVIGYYMALWAEARADPQVRRTSTDSMTKYSQRLCIRTTAK